MQTIERPAVTTLSQSVHLRSGPIEGVTSQRDALERLCIEQPF
jgi:hypothetical protein